MVAAKHSAAKQSTAKHGAKHGAQHTPKQSAAKQRSTQPATPAKSPAKQSAPQRIIRITAGSFGGKTPKRSKYGNKPTYVDGHRFDSQVEAIRYQELKFMERMGVIKDLILQPKIKLLPKSATEKVHTYTADFAYSEVNCGCAGTPNEPCSGSHALCGKTFAVVEDVKSPVTAKERGYIINRKLFKYRFPDVVFRETVR